MVAVVKCMMACYNHNTVNHINHSKCVEMWNVELASGSGIAYGASRIEAGIEISRWTADGWLDAGWWVSGIAASAIRAMIGRHRRAVAASGLASLPQCVYYV